MLSLHSSSGSMYVTAGMVSTSPWYLVSASKRAPGSHTRSVTSRDTPRADDRSLVVPEGHHVRRVPPALPVLLVPCGPPLQGSLVRCDRGHLRIARPQVVVQRAADHLPRRQAQ